MKEKKYSKVKAHIRINTNRIKKQKPTTSTSTDATPSTIKDIRWIKVRKRIVTRRSVGISKIPMEWKYKWVWNKVTREEYERIAEKNIKRRRKPPEMRTDDEHKKIMGKKKKE